MSTALAAAAVVALAPNAHKILARPQWNEEHPPKERRLTQETKPGGNTRRGIRTSRCQKLVVQSKGLPAALPTLTVQPSHVAAVPFFWSGAEAKLAGNAASLDLDSESCPVVALAPNTHKIIARLGVALSHGWASPFLMAHDNYSRTAGRPVTQQKNDLRLCQACRPRCQPRP